MKKALLYLILFSILTPSLFADRTIGFSLVYSQNMEFPQKLVEELNFTNNNFSIYALEHGGQKLLLGASYNLAINRILSHRLMIDTSITYGSSYGSSYRSSYGSSYGNSYNTPMQSSCDTSHSHSYALSGWSGLGYMFNALLTKSTTYVALYLELSLGAQLAVAYSPYFATVLFSITPICETIAGIQFKDFEALTYMSFVTAQAKEWKAVPTIGAKALITIKESHRLGGEVFIKFAEFLTDTSTLVSAFGVRMLYEYKIFETTKRATNENT